MAAQYYESILRWQHYILNQSPDGSTILSINPQMAAQYYESIPRWQHYILNQSPDGSTILSINPQMAAQYYESIPRWQQNILNQTPDDSTIFWINPQMTAQSYESIPRWQHNIACIIINTIFLPDKEDSVFLWRYSSTLAIRSRGWESRCRSRSTAEIYSRFAWFAGTHTTSML